MNGGEFNIHDSETGNRKASAPATLKPLSCSTRAMNPSASPQLNLHIAKAYLAGLMEAFQSATSLN